MPTPEERAAALLSEKSSVGLRLRRHVAPPLLEDLAQAVAQAIREAVRQEREACAKLADETNQWVGDAIRRRADA